MSDTDQQLSTYRLSFAYLKRLVKTHVYCVVIPSFDDTNNVFDDTNSVLPGCISLPSVAVCVCLMTFSLHPAY